ncbi:MAG: GNAT family N-acetyltransferase [Flavobacteriaceae bacterium]|nr:GNAT family N-acetyltransferase [Flavobacteriaceae bacterium]
MIVWHFKTFEELSVQELYEIVRLRIEVFVIEQNAAYQDCDRKDYVSFHLFGTLNDEIVAYCRMIPAGVSYVEPCLGRVVTAARVRNEGYGKLMVELALEAMRNLFNTVECRISGQLYLQKFYESFGFEKVSDVYLEDNLPHIEMLRMHKVG